MGLCTSEDMLVEAIRYSQKYWSAHDKAREEDSLWKNNYHTLFATAEAKAFATTSK